MSFYTIVESLIASFDHTTKTRNKARVGQHRTIPYCQFVPYWKSRLFAHGNLVSTEKSKIASFYTTAELRVLTVVLFMNLINLLGY